MTKKKQTVHKSVVRDRPGHPVAAPCTISGCRYFELRRALEQAVGDTLDKPLVMGLLDTVRQFLLLETTLLERDPIFANQILDFCAQMNIERVAQSRLVADVRQQPVRKPRKKTR